MFQFAFEAVLFKFNAREPQMPPLLQAPNRRATAQDDADPIPFYKNPLQFTFCKVQIFPGGKPPDPLCGYADRWLQKNGRRDAPARIRSSAAQIQRTRATKAPSAASAEPKGHRRNANIYPKAVTSASSGRTFIWECRDCTESRNCPIFMRINSRDSCRIADSSIFVGCPGQVVIVILADLYPAAHAQRIRVSQPLLPASQYDGVQDLVQALSV